MKILLIRCKSKWKNNNRVNEIFSLNLLKQFSKKINIVHLSLD